MSQDARLEHLFGQVAESLKPGGLFFLDEYILEDELIAARMLQHDFAVIIAARR
jgi:hypothetical protein